MSNKTLLTCVVCPNGCELEVTGGNGTEITVVGAKCKKGNSYAAQELLDPQRTIATTIAVTGGTLPLVSVRTDKPIPKARIFDVMKEVNKLTPVAPVAVGDLLIEGVLGLDCNIIATKQVDKAV